jgi:hypothetical protein
LITAQNDIHHEHRLSPRYVSKSTENMRPIAPDRYMPACRKTRLHRVVRNLHLILLAPRERPGMRWGLATLESEDYVLCSYSPHSVTECSPALASLSAFCQVTRARPGPLLISRSSTSGTTTVDLGPALWALPDPVAHVASNRRPHLGVQTSYKSPFTAHSPLSRKFYAAPRYYPLA